MDLEKALRVVEEAADQSHVRLGAGDDVAEAMRFLRDYGVERTTLVWFWKALFGDNEIGRTQNTNAARNRINLLVGELRGPKNGPEVLGNFRAVAAIRCARRVQSRTTGLRFTHGDNAAGDLA
ncbi:hypothetical protein [Novosphingobium panipatense]|nr:hypothetical protein [Novosphingobium panipatense]